MFLKIAVCNPVDQRSGAVQLEGCAFDDVTMLVVIHIVK